MPDATMKDYSELAGAVGAGKFPILPRPEWGQDAAYIAFVLDGFVKEIRELHADELALRAEVAEYRHALEHVAFNHPGQCLDCQRLATSALAGEGRADFEEMVRDSVHPD